MTKKVNRLQNYQAPNETISPLDLMSRRSTDPIFIPVYQPGAEEHPIFVQFYALEWTGKWTREDRGLGHGTTLRAWTFKGFGQRAVGGTLSKPEFGPWVEVRGEFVEGSRGVSLQMKE